MLPILTKTSPVVGGGEGHTHSKRVVNIQVTLTPSEYEQLASAASMSSMSLSDYGRQRITAFPDLQSWGDTAKSLIAEYDSAMAQIEAKKQSLKDKAESHPTISVTRELAEIFGETETTRERRSKRVTVRVNPYESVLVAWRATCCAMSLSDYCRRMILGVNPGQLEEHLVWRSKTGSPHDRLNQYSKLIELAGVGDFPKNTSSFYCKACASELKPEDKS